MGLESGQIMSRSVGRLTGIEPDTPAIWQQTGARDGESHHGEALRLSRAHWMDQDGGRVVLLLPAAVGLRPMKSP